MRKDRRHPGTQLQFTDVDGHRVTASATNTPRAKSRRGPMKRDPGYCFLHRLPLHFDGVDHNLHRHVGHQKSQRAKSLLETSKRPCEQG